MHLACRNQWLSIGVSLIQHLESTSGLFTHSAEVVDKHKIEHDLSMTNQWCDKLLLINIAWMEGSFPSLFNWPPQVQTSSTTGH